MKFKPVPEPPADLDFLADARRAVPLVPGSEDDCCARLQRRLDLQSRDVARTWLTFLRALELAEETSQGFARTDREPTPENLRESLRSRVFGAEALRSVLVESEGPLAVETAFARLRERVPEWERRKRPRRWEEIWAERVENLLDWLVLLDLASRTADGYRATAD